MRIYYFWDINCSECCSVSVSVVCMYAFWSIWDHEFHCVRHPNQALTHTQVCVHFSSTRLKLTSMWVAHNWFLYVFFFLIKWEKRRKKEKRTKVKTESILFCSLSRLVCPYEVNSRRNETKIQSNNKITTADRVI